MSDEEMAKVIKDIRHKVEKIEYLSGQGTQLTFVQPSDKVGEFNYADQLGAIKVKLAKFGRF